MWHPRSQLLHPSLLSLLLLLSCYQTQALLTFGNDVNKNISNIDFPWVFYNYNISGTITRLNFTSTGTCILNQTSPPTSPIAVVDFNEGVKFGCLNYGQILDQVLASNSKFTILIMVTQMILLSPNRTIGYRDPWGNQDGVTKINFTLVPWYETQLLTQDVSITITSNVGPWIIFWESTSFLFSIWFFVALWIITLLLSLYHLCFNIIPQKKFTRLDFFLAILGSVCSILRIIELSVDPISIKHTWNDAIFQGETWFVVLSVLAFYNIVVLAWVYVLQRDMEFQSRTWQLTFQIFRIGFLVQTFFFFPLIFIVRIVSTVFITINALSVCFAVVLALLCIMLVVLFVFTVVIAINLFIMLSRLAFDEVNKALHIRFLILVLSSLCTTILFCVEIIMIQLGGWYQIPSFQTLHIIFEAACWFLITSGLVAFIINPTLLHSTTQGSNAGTSKEKSAEKSAEKSVELSIPLDS